VITTFAGSGVVSSSDGPANTASFQYPASVAVDDDGNVYVADSYNNLLRKITPQGVAATLAGRLGASRRVHRTAAVRPSHSGDPPPHRYLTHRAVKVGHEGALAM